MGGEQAPVDLEAVEKGVWDGLRGCHDPEIPVNIVELGLIYEVRAEEAGSVAVNNVDAGIMNAPYGGWKQSGIGHEHGHEGLEEYLQLKHVRIRFRAP